MEISFRVPSQYYALHSYKANDDKLIEKFENIFENIESEHSYKNLRIDIARGRVGDSRWRSIGYFLMISPFLLLLFVFNIFLPSYSRAPLTMGIYILLFFLGVFFFLLSLRKENWIWFYNKQNGVAFAVKVEENKKEETEKFLQYVIERIKTYQ